ncbi:hypothetical protein [Streptomyces subrutilus]|uniref:Uncharacterized protein n=1 Tax=Streptomyces subrutilus TaxID=36818 RepID=A0A1E5NXS8_9ACTN|nr:hypothetical protein [Streptomyces subrutilus]OEJ21050.1 hypothetical protein BGK67_34710 [Streptomyces subrutilus]
MTLSSLTVPAPTAGGPAGVSPLVRPLAEGLAAALPARGGNPWTVQPYRAWWTIEPAVRLVQGLRALVVVADGPWDTEVAWQLPGREPTGPDLRVGSHEAARIARGVLRLVLPVLDDEAATRSRPGAPLVMGRLDALNEIGTAIRGRGLATHNHVGLHANSSVLAWGTPSGLRYAVTMHGSNPVCDLSVTGPVRAVERVLPGFLPLPSSRTPRHPMRHIKGRLARRLAAHLVHFTGVDQLDDEGLAIGTATGPYGYVSPALDPVARVRDSTPAAVELHAVGVDLLLSLAAELTR